MCGRTDCHSPDFEQFNRADYPFLPGGGDPMGTRNWIIAPHRVVDEALGRVMYGTGQRVPIADAVKYGLIPATDAPPEEREVDPAPEPTNALRGRRTRHHEAPSEVRS